MAKVIRFPKTDPNKAPENLNEALARASSLFKEDLPELKEGLTLVNPEKMRRIIEALIIKVLMQNQMIEVGYFLCGNYVSGLLSDLSSNVPESWFAIDFYAKGSAEGIRRGANLCFLLCALFPGRTNIRAMSFHDYEDLGRGLYLRFYSSTGAEIGYLMGKNFSQMIVVARQAVEKLS
jgi:lipid-binding SYLF domain-containing protein